jgi:hypothetical protein
LGVTNRGLRVRRLIQLLLIFILAAHQIAIAQTDMSADNLMVVLRESMGASKQDETLKPTGKGKVKLPDGKEVEIEMASFEFIGDMHLRFVFDEPKTMRGATPQDLARLKLDPDAALKLAVANVKRVYGNPTIQPFSGSIKQIQGKSPDVDSSYFLDRDLWRGLLKQHPEGLVVAVPKRGGLLYAPLSDAKAVETLRKGVSYLHASSEWLRVSSALYLFNDDRWTVFKAPVARVK